MGVKSYLSDSELSLMALPCLLTECFFICRWDERTCFEPEVTFHCAVTGQGRAQPSLKSLVHGRTAQRKLFLCVVSGEFHVQSVHTKGFIL